MYGFPEIVIIRPSSGRLGLRRIVSRPVKTSNAEPEITVMLPGSVGMVVWLGVTKSEVLERMLVLPVSPGGAFPTGIDVVEITQEEPRSLSLCYR
jgi:hypothetical protein